MKENQNGPKSVADNLERVLDFYGAPENHVRPDGGQSSVERDGGQAARDVLKQWTGKGG